MARTIPRKDTVLRKKGEVVKAPNGQGGKLPRRGEGGGEGGWDKNMR